MKQSATWKNKGILWILLVILAGLIVCPLIMVFAEAVIIDGRLDLHQAWSIIADSENLQTIWNSLLLGVCVVLCSTVFAAPTAYLLARTQLARYKWLDIVFMVPFMTPPYIASMGWILFMQKRGLFQQLFPFTGSFSEGFFSFGGLVLVMTLNVFPFMMTILKNAILNIPASLEESGAVFGAGFGLRLRKIFAPLLTETLPSERCWSSLRPFPSTARLILWTPYRFLRIYDGHSPIFHHSPCRFRKIRQPVLGADLHLYGPVDAAELYYKQEQLPSGERQGNPPGPDKAV